MKAFPTPSVRRSPRKRAASTQRSNDVNYTSSPVAKTSNFTSHFATINESTLFDLETTNDDNNTQLLRNWLQHNNHSFHLSFLSPPQSLAIRCALVHWYRANRRKLPWRGDLGPYDGSTAGFGNGERDKKKMTAKSNSNGGDIRSFFGGADSKRKKIQSEISGEEKKEDEQSSTTSSRNETRQVSAYGVWVSEIMLQQTRVEAVIPYYLKWMQSFPTVESLANATPEQVNSHWAGLGFYRRARLLHEGAKRVVDEYGGVVPDTVEELMKVCYYVSVFLCFVAH
jgi:A/G-specific adenine glycosylase